MSESSSNTQRTVLVTGASSGIGKEIAKSLVAEGFTVYVAARSVDKMADLAEMGATPIRMDMSKPEEIEAGFAQIQTEQGGIDVLVNNAGFGLYGAVEDVSIDEARYQFEVNLFGLARLTQLALPYMREKKAGTIVNMSSMGGKIYTPLGAWYHATKHALEGWSDCLRLEVEPLGIHVVIIEPGLIATEFGNTVAAPMKERQGSGAYEELVKTLTKATEDASKPGGGSEPSVIADVVLKAVKAKKPKTRYLAGRMAKPLVFLRGLVGDRTFDKLVMSQVK